jgi:cytochrome P450
VEVFTMTMYADAVLPTLAPGDFGPAIDVRGAMTAARHRSSLARGVFGPLVMRHEHVSALLRDKRLRGPGMDLAMLSGIPVDSRTWRRNAQILLFMEGEDHHRLRRLVSKAFTPSGVERLRPFTRATIAGLVDAVIDDGACDAAKMLCEPFPIPIISELIGVDSDRWEDMSRWATSALLSLRLDAGQHMAEMEQALEELDDYVRGLIEQRRQQPKDDLLSRLVLAEEDGDRLSPSELLSVVGMMLVAGTDTTRNQLACMLHTFSEHPDQWELLRARPELVPPAVEEAIRWEPATEALPRFAIEDIEIDGIHIPAGSVVMLVSMSANHDTAALDDAERFDITRTTPAGWHMLTFGGGIHYCLGASLARLELVEALAELSSRLPTVRPAGEPIANPIGSVIQGYQSLPIRWT